ncbi:MAG TPA: hypothetical protein VNP04_18740 [Alphaproteobacteria bacterium]|nr:hypothetical protein [Alphaproteobacteria bacterium]
MGRPLMAVPLGMRRMGQARAAAGPWGGPHAVAGEPVMIVRGRTAGPVRRPHVFAVQPLCLQPVVR